jgi:predicted CXXCH cytochrome family protein
MKKILLLLSAALVIGFAVSLYMHKDLSDTPHYVTSQNCQQCHQENYDSWKHNTLHPLMFRPVKSPSDILGDFDNADPKVVTFSKEEVEYVVGNKWEQVYVRMIDGEYYPLPAKWYVMQNRWVPYKVKDWKETPMSYKCNGCHTTGFDATTLKFAEFGIGCEACHGPGSTHVQNKTMAEDTSCTVCHSDEADEKLAQKDIIRTVSASVCGQCHNRGTNKEGEAVHANKFNFPVNFSPDGNIDEALNPSTPQNDKKGKYWWGNGVSKNRHQEFSDWGKSKHANAHRLLVEKYEEGGERGELQDSCLKCHSTDFRHAKFTERPSLDTAKHGVTCVACHEPHGKDRAKATYEDGSSKCATCHIASLSEQTAKTGKPHTPCPATAVSCADCHMPRVVKTGGFFSLRSHAFRIISPTESMKTSSPNSCQNGGCHSGQTVEWAAEAFRNHYPEFQTIPVPEAK